MGTREREREREGMGWAVEREWIDLSSIKISH